MSGKEEIIVIIEDIIKNMTEKEIAIYSLTEYQKELISLGITEKIRKGTKEEMIKIYNK